MPLRRRLGRIDRAHGPANDGGLWAAVERDRGRMELDPENQIACVVATRETWNGVIRLLAGGRRRWTLAGSSCRDFRCPTATASFGAIEASGLSRSRLHQSSGARASRALDRLHDAAGGVAAEEGASAERCRGNVCETAARDRTSAVRARNSNRDRRARAPTVLRSMSCRQRPMWGCSVPAQHLNQRRRHSARSSARRSANWRRNRPRACMAFARSLAEADRADAFLAGGEADAAEPVEAPDESKPRRREPASMRRTARRRPGPTSSAEPMPAFEPALLDRLPLGRLIDRHDGRADTPPHANRYSSNRSGYQP